MPLPASLELSECIKMCISERYQKSEEPERWVSCYWEDEVGEAFRSTLQITATDRTGLLADVTIKLSDMHIFIHSLNSITVFLLRLFR